LAPAGCAGFGACGPKRVGVLALERCHLAHGQRPFFDRDLHVRAPLSVPRIAELARCWALRGHLAASSARHSKPGAFPACPFSIGIPAPQREQLRTSDRVTLVDDRCSGKVEQIHYRALGA
jgi:hypothetical protein